jgi:serine/threonine protein kinase
MGEPGTILVEKYRIEHVLAKGGMGVVARAHHLIVDVPVAIKFLLPDALEQEETVQRFLREAQAAARLKSEHVSRIIDVGLLATSSRRTSSSPRGPMAHRCSSSWIWACPRRRTP